MPKDGGNVPSDWLLNNRHKICVEIASRHSETIFSYSHYQTGKFHNGIAAGVMLQFASLENGEDVFAFFNADLTRKRASKYKDKGSPLPKGQFTVGSRSAFNKFWDRTGLDQPRWPSEWYKVIGNLKGLLLVGEIGSTRKLINSTIKPLSLSSQSINSMFHEKRVRREGEESEKDVRASGESSTGERIERRNGEKDFSVYQVNSCMQEDSKCGPPKARVHNNAFSLSTDIQNHDQSNQVMTNNVSHIPNKKDPKEQSIEEWLSDYEAAG